MFTPGLLDTTRNANLFSITVGSLKPFKGFSKTISSVFLNNFSHCCMGVDLTPPHR